ncbi:S9 family peptidase [Anaerococcus sp. AGMB00486]|uniref:S9 family peptidase n=1 Tax=Anaerococcus faecalis TaxID=2742993 RepID=A0ABX2N9G0_9FIRM|nr:S9 family peptidase [Anaerococcus faecalis]NVF11326.1 S9 family peptidase [Anaerococcus faecalis]
MEKTKIKDILDYKFYSNLEISYDNKYLAFKSSKANLKENKYDSFLNLYDIEKKASYKVSDNNNINLFFFDRENILIFKEKSDDKYDYFYKKDMTLNVSQPCFKINKNVSFIKVLKDGRFLIKASDKLSKEEREEEKENSFYKEITKVPFYYNGLGYDNDKIESLYFYDKDKDELKEIRKFDNSKLQSFAINDNLDKIAVTVLKSYNGVGNLKEDLILIDFKKNIEKIIIRDKFSYYDIFFDNDRIVFVGSDHKKGGINEDCFIYETNFQGNYIKISPDDFDKSFGNSIGTDARFGSGRSFYFKNSTLYFLVTEKEESKLYSFDKEKNLKLLKDGCVEEFVVGDNKIYYFAMDDKRLSHLKDLNNDEILIDNKVKSAIGKIEEFYFESNGDKIRGFVLLPTDFDKNKIYPTLLSIHGGPKTEFSNIFHHEHQVFSNDGYIVIYTNPHGSSGNGVAYSDIRGKYGSIDYEDLMKFTNEAIKRYPQIDINNLGVYGGSYGGFMTNWIVSHTDRFKAANSQRSISNWTSFYGVSDIGYYFAPDQTGANPWDNLNKMWEQSPIKHAKNVKTPTMFIHSDEDYRCPLEQGLQMYTRIKENGVDSKMYIFHGENHELSRSGKPKARIKRLEAIKEWFDTYLK